MVPISHQALALLLYYSIQCNYGPTHPLPITTSQKSKELLTFGEPSSLLRMPATSIRSIEFKPLNLPLTEPFAIASGAQMQVENVVIRVTLEDGTTGIGEAAPFPVVSGETQTSTLQALQQLANDLIKKDARQWHTISTQLRGVALNAPAARCGLEMAFLDALCRHYNMPLYVFFGGTGTELRTDMTITAGTVAHAADSAKAIWERGITTIKVKTEGEDVAIDLARLQAIHDAAPEARLLIDGNCGYRREKALELINKLAQAGIHPALFEQPVACDDLQSMASIAELSLIPVAADESARSAKDVLRLVEEKAAQVINIKLMKCGLSEALDMIAIARGAGLQLMIGGMVESVLAMSFSAHLAAGMGGFSFVDLDTPLFIPEHPFLGGYTQQGELMTLSAEEHGHGVTLPDEYFADAQKFS